MSNTEQEAEKKAMEEFVARYQVLVKETGYDISFVPQMRQSQDTGVWGLVIVPTVIKVPTK